jgi:hypothetical protein
MKLLVIRNLQLKLIEFADKQISEVVSLSSTEKPDYILVSGNISRHDKRSLFFAEEVATATGKKVIYAPGLLEYSCLANYDMWLSGVLIRLKANAKKTNVFFADDVVDDAVEFKHVLGWPIILDNQDKLSLTVPGRFLIKERISKYMNGEHVSEFWPVAFQVDDYMTMHNQETVAWDTTKKKILIRSVPDENDLILTVSYTSQHNLGEDILISNDASLPNFEIIEF